MEETPPDQPREDRADPSPAVRRTPWRWIIIGVVALLVVAGIVVAAGSYWWFSDKVETANERTSPEVSNALAAEPSTTLVSIEPSTTLVSGEPQPVASEAMNVILIGSEATGADGGKAGRSSTIMVLHVDPALDFACLLSVPRDLYVDIPGHGKNRITTAYTLGGPELTIATVKELLGLNIDRYAEIDFDAFAKIIDSLGGVYVDVDRQYKGTRTRPIDLKAGYQLLNGSDALAFARYRYDKNQDPGRLTRQQRVLAAVREQAFRWDLPVKLPGIVSTALEATATNLTANEIIKLAYWLVKLDGDHMRQIVISGTGQTVDGRPVITADEETLKGAVTALLTSPVQAASGGSTTGTTGSAGSTSPTTSPSTSAAASATTSTGGASGGGAYPDTAMWKAAQKSVPFALEAPRYIPVGYKYVSKMPGGDGTYPIEPGGDSKPAVRMLYRNGTKDLYLGITATTWTDAPAASDGTAVDVNGTTFTVVGTSGKVDRIWWEKDGVLYFISNTLMYDVSREDLMKMAVSMAGV